jgi:ELWxxDGT repeat protein
VFNADDGVAGDELWISDGTSGGTLRASDVNLGQAGSGPRGFRHSGGRLVFSAQQVQTGRELWVLDLPATAQSFGHGCASSGRQPTLLATDPVLGANLGLRGEEGVGPAAAVVFVGRPTTTPGLLAPGCEVYLEPTLLVPLLTVPVSGRRWSTILPIPNDQSLAGAKLVLQAFLAPSGSPLGFDSTNAVLLVLGR